MPFAPIELIVKAFQFYLPNVLLSNIQLMKFWWIKFPCVAINSFLIISSFLCSCQVPYERKLCRFQLVHVQPFLAKSQLISVSCNRQSWRYAKNLADFLCAKFWHSGLRLCRKAEYTKQRRLCSWCSAPIKLFLSMRKDSFCYFFCNLERPNFHSFKYQVGEPLSWKGQHQWSNGIVWYWGALNHTHIHTCWSMARKPTIWTLDH